MRKVTFVLVLALAIVAIARHHDPVSSTTPSTARPAEFSEPTGPAKTAAFARPPRPERVAAGSDGIGEPDEENETVSLPEAGILARLLENPADPAEAMRRGPEWVGSLLASEIATALLSSGPEARALLAELVLEGRLDLPLRELQDEYIAAARAEDPARRMRAVSRLSPDHPRAGELLVLVVRGSDRPDIRHEALRVLDRAHRGHLVSQEEREAVLREFEAFVGPCGPD